MVRKSRRHIGDARLAEDFAVAFEAQAHRELGARPGVLLARRYPAAAQRGEHGPDGAEPFRSLAIGLVRAGSCIGLAIPALDGQLQLLAEGIFEFRRAGTMAEHAADLMERTIDARTPVEHAAYQRMARSRRNDQSRQEGGGADEDLRMSLEASSHRPTNKRRLAPQPGEPCAPQRKSQSVHVLAAIGRVPAVVQPIVVDARNEHAAAVRLAGPPACVGDAHRGREAQALRRAAMQLRFRHERLLQVPALAGARERHPGECQQ